MDEARLEKLRKRNPSFSERVMKSFKHGYIYVGMRKSATGFRFNYDNTLYPLRFFFYFILFYFGIRNCYFKKKKSHKA